MTMFEAPTQFESEFEWESALAEAPSSFEDEDFVSRYGPVKGTPTTTTGAAIVMTVEGTKQGKFKGDTAKTLDNTIAATLASYSLVSPRDVATGQASGKRRHAPIVARQALAPSTVQFFQALFTNEILKSVVISLGGVMNITLSNASVSGVRLLGENGLSIAEIAFTFQKVQLTHLASAVTAADDWMSPVA
jgi:type VI secretion system secreted protein Hcp